MEKTIQTEQEMRDSEVPWFESEEQLVEYIRDLLDREHDYGTCVYAMSLAATATFNYVAKSLGVTGFQASCADLDFLRRTRSMEGPFVIITAEHELYPQYDNTKKLQEAQEGWKEWITEQAKKKLEEVDTPVAKDVRAHWLKLAGE